MRDYLNKLPKEIQDLIHLASDIAASHNMRAYLVGGFVRDLILGVKNLDLDIVVEGNGIKFAADLASILKAKLVRHHRFGTATVVLRHHFKVDIASARKETYPHPGSLPVVSLGNIKDDLTRRDFSINAMAISIMQKDFGTLLDYFRGKSDLRNKRIRVLHELSFMDDPTRILRAIRFEQRYNFKIEPQTLKLLRKAAKLEMLERVQPQRLRDDLVLILKENEPIREIKRIKELVGFSFISPSLKVTASTYKFLSSLRGEISWFKKNYAHRRSLEVWLIYLAGLIDSLDIPGTKKFFKEYVLRKGEEKRILGSKKISRKSISELTKARLRPSRIYQLLEPLSYEVIILLKARYKNKYLERHIEDFLEIYNGMRIFTSGHDLHLMGLAPGPHYQKIFACVLKAKLEGKVKTKEEEILLIKKLLIKHR
jgi:tRNA nucleotidyltransferase (CCA-adding enzyme)